MASNLCRQMTAWRQTSAEKTVMVCTINNSVTFWLSRPSSGGDVILTDTHQRRWPLTWHILNWFLLFSIGYVNSHSANCLSNIKTWFMTGCKSANQNRALIVAHPLSWFTDAWIRSINVKNIVKINGRSRISQAREPSEEREDMKAMFLINLP